MDHGPVVRVLTDVARLDKEFDYLVPDNLAGTVTVGTMLRVALHGRRVGAWVVADDVTPDPGVVLRPVARRRGWGPEPALVALASWAAWRWAGRRAALLRTASPPRAVPSLPRPSLAPPPPPMLGTPTARSVGDMVAEALGPPAGPPGAAVLRLPPAIDVTGVVAAVAQRGPTLVVVPGVAGAVVLASRLRRAGAGVALVPDGWAQARAGAAVVVGSRAAAWAPCPGLAAVVVVDGHDESLHQEQNPTWDAVSVAVERARRAAVPCLITSPCPTVHLLAATGSVVRPARRFERAGWAPVEIVDRRGDDPRLGLYSEALVRLVRRSERVACVLNRTGRARLVGCRACGALARCERCGTALGEGGRDSEASLVCRQCGWGRPWVCAQCGSMSLRRLRVGVSRAREELEALTGAPVVEVTATSPAPPRAGRVIAVGTEAVLHRGVRWDGVAFLDFDSELLAPRYRAAEEALALLARASRLVGGRRRDEDGAPPPGRVLIQTRVPDHDVVLAAAAADPERVSSAERSVRAELRLPPCAAVAALSGAGAAELVTGLAGATGVELAGPDDTGRWLARSAHASTLADALAAVPRPASRVRVEVDPLRV